MPHIQWYIDQLVGPQLVALCLKVVETLGGKCIAGGSSSLGTYPQGDI